MANVPLDLSRVQTPQIKRLELLSYIQCPADNKTYYNIAVSETPPSSAQRILRGIAWALTPLSGASFTISAAAFISIVGGSPILIGLMPLGAIGIVCLAIFSVCVVYLALTHPSYVILGEDKIEIYSTERFNFNEDNYLTYNIEKTIIFDKDTATVESLKRIWSNEMGISLPQKSIKINNKAHIPFNKPCKLHFYDEHSKQYFDINVHIVKKAVPKGPTALYQIPKGSTPIYQSILESNSKTYDGIPNTIDSDIKQELEIIHKGSPAYKRPPKELGKRMIREFKLKEVGEKYFELQKSKEGEHFSMHLFNQAFKEISESYTTKQLLDFGETTHYFSVFNAEACTPEQKEAKILDHIKFLFSAYVHPFFLCNQQDLFCKQQDLSCKTTPFLHVLNELAKEYLQCSVSEKDENAGREFLKKNMKQFLEEPESKDQREKEKVIWEAFRYQAHEIITVLNSASYSNASEEMYLKEWYTPLALFDHLLIDEEDDLPIVEDDYLLIDIDEDGYLLIDEKTHSEEVA